VIITCPHCKNHTKFLFSAQDYNRKTSDKIFEYYQCQTCNLIFLSPIPANLKNYYPPQYYHFPETLEKYIKQVDFQRYKIDLVEQFVTPGELLEIGSGPGDFAIFAKQRGFAVTAIEMDQDFCHFLREIIEVNVINSDDPLSALKPLGQYSVIALWQVIEHLTNPWDLLDELHHHLQPNGILIVATPNPDSLQFKLFRQYWAHLDAPRHLSLIPSKLLLQRLGTQYWEQILMTSTDFSGWAYNRFGWQRSIKNLSERFLPADFLGALINRLVAPLESYGQNGATYIAIFKKKS
jgi:SAM-dependent methyltransferase